MPSQAVTFFLLCFFLSLHACNSRILLAKDIARGRGLGPESVMEFMGSKLQDSESVPSMKAFCAMTAKHPLSLQKGRCADGGNHHENTKTGTPKIEKRRLQEKTAAAHEHDAKDTDNDVVQDAVVMDYAHPHRKPPIHNEEN